LPAVTKILVAALPGVIAQLASALASMLPVLVDTIKGLFAQVWDYIAVELLGTQADFESTFSVVGEVCSEAFNNIRELVIEVISVIKSKWGEMADAALGAWDAIVEAFSPIADILGSLFELALVMVQTVWSNAPAYFGAIMDTITGIFSVVEAVLSGDFQAAWDAIMSIVDTWQAYFQGKWESIKAVFADANSVGSKIIEDIKQGISAAWDGLVGWFKGIWDGLFGNLSANVSVNASSSGTDGSHASGLDYVPFDGYIAELHRGERVLTAKQAAEYNNQRPNVNVVQNIYSEAKTAADLMQEALYQQERAVLLGV
jgi:phage-related protein